MGDKFSKDKFPWYSGVLADLRVNSDDTLILKPGKTVGTYTTIVYNSVGSMVSVSWDADEASGEINTNAGVSPKTIEMRVSNTEPTGKVVAISGASLQPYLTNNIFDTGDGWSVVTSGISTESTISARSLFRLNVGVPFSRTPPNDQVYINSGGTWVITPGLVLVLMQPSTLAARSLMRIGIGLVVANNIITEELKVSSGTLIINGVYVT